jgi:hypothetical protein
MDPGRTPGVEISGRGELLTDAEAFDQSAIAIEVLLLDVVEQTPSAANQLEESSSAVVVLGVALEVFSELFDSGGEQSNLDLR